MVSRLWVSVIITLGVGFLSAGAAYSQGAPQFPQSPAPRAVTLPVAFEENRGQFERHVAYRARTRSGTVTIGDDGSITVSGSVSRFRLDGARRAQPQGTDQLPARAVTTAATTGIDGFRTCRSTAACVSPRCIQASTGCGRRSIGRLSTTSSCTPRLSRSGSRWSSAGPRGWLSSTATCGCRRLAAKPDTVVLARIRVLAGYDVRSRRAGGFADRAPGLRSAATIGGYR